MSKMLDEFMKRFEKNVVEGKENLEAREAAEKKAADEAALEEQRLIKEEQELLEYRRTRLGELAANLKYLPMVEKIIDMHYLVDGITVFARTTDGNAYEFMIRPAEYAKGFGAYRKSSKPVKEEQVNEISLKTKTNAYSRAMDPEFDYYADGTHNPERKLGQAERIRAAIAKKHGQEAADQADDQAAYDHYGDYMFKDRKVPSHVKQREAVNELSDKKLKKYVKKATKSADSLQYYSDSRLDPDWEKAQKRKKMVDVAKKKLGEETERERAERLEIEYGQELKREKVRNEIRKHRDEERKRMKKAFDYTPKKWVAVDEGFPLDVDHMPGPLLRGKNSPLSKGCTTCHGRKAMYSLNGKLHADNPGQGAKRIVCPACHGTGILNPAIPNLRETNNSARIVVKPSDLTHPDDDGAVERTPKAKDVAKNIKDVSKRYDVHVVKDFGKYTKNK